MALYTPYPAKLNEAIPHCALTNLTSRNRQREPPAAKQLIIDKAGCALSERYRIFQYLLYMVHYPFSAQISLFNLEILGWRELSLHIDFTRAMTTLSNVRFAPQPSRSHRAQNP